MPTRILEGPPVDASALRMAWHHAQEPKRYRAGIAELVLLVGTDVHGSLGFKRMGRLGLVDLSHALKDDDAVLEGVAVAGRVSARGQGEQAYGERGRVVLRTDEQLLCGAYHMAPVGYILYACLPDMADVHLLPPRTKRR